ncbi:PTS system mannose/fructose/sorbose family transporter subunit IID [Alkalibacterium sp. m-11]|uniref:PTS system, mannose-specific IID component n=1 Tax=Alkalibacterium thalassium TaxID=426701 RepID=A0A1G8ZPP8_9LACT|nr:PTS system mannose/fructose/sorbose family transporter subunit IID [Alkalibacterium thalassium]SDK16554.1 PTS system, mannose-specific IID component [Alkalibacterium thalassium]
MAEESKFKLSKRDRLHVFWRSQFLQASWNFERMQNIGWAYAMIPALKKMYTSKEDRSLALKRHLEFFNTHPYLAAPVLGVTLTLEEQKASGQDIDNAAIQGVKIGMMGPLAGVGDPIFWGTIRPVLGAFAASLALSESWLGPIIFFLAWNIIRMAFLWYSQELGYVQGGNITQNLAGGLMQKLTQGASVLGMFILGVLVPRWTSMHFPLVMSRVDVPADEMVNFGAVAEAANEGVLSGDMLRGVVQEIQSGLSITPVEVTTLQNTLDELLPGIAPLMLTLACVWLLRRKVSPITIIAGLFVLGTLGYVVGLLG